MKNRYRTILLAGLAIALACSTPIFAQKGEISKQDAAKVDKAWRQFLDALERKDMTALATISLNRVECVSCIQRPPGNLEYHVGLDTFLSHVYQDWPPGLLSTMAGKEYLVNTIVTSNTPIAVKSNKKHFLVYELIFTTPEGGGHTPHSGGGRQLFQFIEVDGALKFLGMVPVP